MKQFLTLPHNIQLQTGPPPPLVCLTETEIIEKLNQAQSATELNEIDTLKYQNVSYLPRPSLTNILLVNFSPDLSLNKTLDLGVGLDWLSIIRESSRKYFRNFIIPEFSQIYLFWILDKQGNNDERLKSNILDRFTEWELRGWKQRVKLKIDCHREIF